MMEEKSKVVLMVCEDYEEERVYTQLKKGLSYLGGLSFLIGSQEKILLKPNLLKRSAVEKAVITHPAVVGAFGRILREEGYGDIRLGDSGGTGTTGKTIAGTGMDTAMEALGIPAVEFTEGVKVAYAKGHQAHEFVLAKEALEADAIVNLCKMKTHALERITGGVKNMYGCVQGFHKAKGHTKYPSADSFARMLVDLNQILKPRLCIMDGIVAMEGNGPGSGDPVPMKVLLLSQDAVALDTVFCYLIQLKPELVPTIYHGEKLGLGQCDPEKICLLTEEGELSFKEVQARYGKADFVVDRKRGTKSWSAFARFFNVIQRKPYILEERCVHCGICVESCPVEGKAVTFANGKNQAPIYDYKKCIRCFCCQEMCPKKAIQVKGRA